MSVYCDWCGEIIDASTCGLTKVEVTGWHEDGTRIYDTTRHFHAGDVDDDDSCIMQALVAVDQRRAKSERERERDERRALLAAHDAVRKAWDEMPRERREALALQALSDDHLTIRELSGRMSGELGAVADQWGRSALYQSAVGNLVKRMVREGQLEREPETFNKTHLRYRYFRRRGLAGPIADLDRAYREESR